MEHKTSFNPRTDKPERQIHDRHMETNQSRMKHPLQVAKRLTSCGTLDFNSSEKGTGIRGEVWVTMTSDSVATEENLCSIPQEVPLCRLEFERRDGMANATAFLKAVDMASCKWMAEVRWFWRFPMSSIRDFVGRGQKDYQRRFHAFLLASQQLQYLYCDCSALAARQFGWSQYPTWSLKPVILQWIVEEVVDCNMWLKTFSLLDV